MDCKDLTICDYVIHNGATKIIDAVYLYSVSVHEPSKPWGVAKSELVSVDDIEPIPLTEEILVKNGFASSEGYAYLNLDENNFLEFCYYNHRLSKIYMGIEIDDWNNHAKVRDVTFVCQCYYVHEFQHALRLCGVEKSIIL